MKRRSLALILVCAMLVGMLAACGGSNGGSNGANQGAAGSTAEATEWTWPLAEKKEVSVWLQWTNDYLENPNEVQSVQEIEKNTNVHVNWQTVGANEAQEKFGIMLASGSYPDIMRGVDSYYPGGTAKGVQDRVLLEITDLVDKYMPNYKRLIESDPEVLKDVKTDDGRMVGPWTLASHFGEIKGESVWAGMALRGDWLNDLGLEVPRTIADWEKVLVAFKENYPDCVAPLMIGTNGADMLSDFVSAYGVLKAFYKDGNTVKYGPMEDGYRQWLELFHDWYSRGLIDQNFTSSGADLITPFDFIGTGKAGAGCFLWGHTADAIKLMGYTDDPDFNIIATSTPVLNEGDTPEISLATSNKVKEQLGISAKVKDQELVLRYLDYWYSEECMLLDSLGIADKDYYVSDDGLYHLTDEFKTLYQGEGAQYPTVSAAEAVINMHTARFGLYNWGMFDAMNEGEKTLAAYDEFNKSKFDLMIPSTVTKTDEENTEYSQLFTDIETLTNENTVKFITGEKPLSEWDSYVAQLKQYNVERCIAIQQAALDRYNAR